MKYCNNFNASWCVRFFFSLLSFHSFYSKYLFYLQRVLSGKRIPHHFSLVFKHSKRVTLIADWMRANACANKKTNLWRCRFYVKNPAIFTIAAAIAYSLYGLLYIIYMSGYCRCLVGRIKYRLFITLSMANSTTGNEPRTRQHSFYYATGTGFWLYLFIF